MWKTAAAIESSHHENSFDVLHGFWADQGGVVTSALARRLSIPNVVTAMAGELTHEPLIAYGKRKRPIAGRLARFGAARADALIVNSRYHADRISTEQHGLDPQVLPLGYDAERFCADGPADALHGDIPVLSVGSLVPVKGQAVLLEAFAAALAQVPGLHLNVIGKGELEPDLCREARKLGIDGSVTFHGHVEHDRLPACYRGASFCVLSSYFESHGMVILEAAGCGCVTIGTNVGSMREFCQADFLVQPGDAATLAKSIATVAMDAELRQSMSEAAFNKATAVYTLDQSVYALEDLYAQTIAKVAGSR
jgi:glycosyltransferase involved in cell wall biosynthesis